MAVDGLRCRAVFGNGYFDHIIRNETDAAHVIEYIANNPANWRTDRYNAM